MYIYITYIYIYITYNTDEEIKDFEIVNNFKRCDIDVAFHSYLQMVSNGFLIYIYIYVYVLFYCILCVLFYLFYCFIELAIKRLSLKKFKDSSIKTNLPLLFAYVNVVGQ